MNLSHLQIQSATEATRAYMSTMPSYDECEAFYTLLCEIGLPEAEVVVLDHMEMEYPKLTKEFKQSI